LELKLVRNRLGLDNRDHALVQIVQVLLGLDPQGGDRVAPHVSRRRAGGALRAAAAVAVAAADHVPRDPRAGAAVRCGHGGGPWPPGCSWSGCRAPGSAGASDSWGTPSADATESLRGTQNGREK